MLSFSRLLDPSTGRQLRASIVFWLLFAALLASPARALAQPPPPTEAAAAPPAADGADARKKAGEHYNRAYELLVKGACGAGAVPAQSTEALTELLESVRLFPRPNRKYLAAVCHWKLGHPDEALDLYTAVLAELIDPPADLKEIKAEAQKAVLKLRPTIGSLLVEGGATGATILIDGRIRGEFPTPAPLSVSRGLHIVEVYLSGFGAFKETFTVAPGELTKVTARLPRLTNAGRLGISETNGEIVEVLLDGTKVGTTPWEGPVPEGKHTVVLRGKQSMGTQPMAVTVERDKLETVTLAVERLDAQLAVLPNPTGATVEIDAAFLGRGAYQGNLRPGRYAIRVIADGFFPETKQVTLEQGSDEVLRVALRRDPASPVWRKPSRFTLELSGGLPLSPSFGGDIAGTCGESCSKGPGFGGLVTFKGGYELGTGIGVGVNVGYLAMVQATTGRATSLKPVGFPKAEAIADDTVSVRGFVAGVWAGYSLGERFPLRMRLGLGGLFGVVSDQRTGTFTAQNTMAAGKTTPFEALPQAPSAAWFYLAPEIRIGMRLGNHIELSAGLEALVLFTVRSPLWDNDELVNAAGDGAATFKDDLSKESKGNAITSNVLLAVTPGLGARYDF